MDSKILKSLLLVAVLLICSCIFIFYSQQYNEIFAYISICGGLVSYGILISFWSDTKDELRVIGFLRRIITIAPIFIMGYVVFSLHKTYEDYELRKYGTPARGMIINLTKSSTRSGTHYYAIIQYQINNETYLQRLDNNSHFYKYQDSVVILCSSQDPEIIKVTGIKRAYDAKF